MGKRRLDKIQKIESKNHRRVTFCKRKKGLLKKSIELSLLCDVDVFVFIYDKNNKSCTHFGSNPKLNMLKIFNDRCNREFFSNRDYVQVGGRPGDISDFGDAGSDSEVNSQLQQVLKQVHEDKGQNV